MPFLCLWWKSARYWQLAFSSATPRPSWPKTSNIVCQVFLDLCFRGFFSPQPSLNHCHLRAPIAVYIDILLFSMLLCDSYELVGICEMFAFEILIACVGIPRISAHQPFNGSISMESAGQGVNFGNPCDRKTQFPFQKHCKNAKLLSQYPLLPIAPHLCWPVEHNWCHVIQCNGCA